MLIKRISHIDIVESIGSGGTARIYKGVDMHTGYLVAVKILWNKLFRDQGMKERFLREANHYLYLDHPNIVTLKDFIQRDDASYLIMEFVEGQNLEEYINNFSGPIPAENAVRLILDVLAGIQYAHENNVLHLDIKPSNIMVTKNGTIKVIDFGISSKFLEVNKGSIMGSPLYMSPEQTEGINIDPRTDVYSLGITFFQMLTGTTPLKGNMSRDELFQKIRKGNLPRAKTFYPFIADDLQEIIDKATHIDKRKRYQSAADFSIALNNLRA